MEACLKLKTRIIAGTPVIEADGELGHAGISEFRAEVSRLIERGHTTIVVDMLHVDFMDSGGLSGIIYTMKQLDSLNGEVILAGCCSRVLRKLEIGGLSKLSDALRLAPTVEHAIP